ncbi:MAG: FKBP-type peptidyl-prolyl cis-trans isomerase [Bacteroidales bacterium]|jgi:FKBP-type peptidyl-prolyl cis-trans isomerase FklB|nr:FKBP-type peptidyl-prolyl cis-trans isomerase [Bacteroidales bacterium]
MRKIQSLLVLLSFGVLAIAQTPQNYIDSVSYSLGIDISKNLKKGGLDTIINAEFIALGLQDALSNNDLQITEEQSQILTQIFLYTRQEEQKKEQYQENVVQGQSFLKENKKNKDIQVTSSGLQYKIIKAGNGQQPTAKDKVTVHYKGSLLDGTEFDSSYKRGKPATFGVTQVIPGFSEALQLMSPGAHYIVYIPQELAYGSRSTGQIEPYSTLIFEIEMIEIPTTNLSEETATQSNSKTNTKPKK